ncbi:4048_t:CDS:2 [Acaulospora colombiana]|uniref:4048_t:CDS:1 n=1 Tax=Acaulospora colombiana TaxID=27376 RepID=A0ACA9LC25_9GLOM|nr:4048_t:CDS:2 [Acaulospora colombiana]
MLSVDKATGPYSQYEVDQSEKQSVSSGSSSSVSFSNTAVSEKMNDEEKRKRPKRNSFRRIFGQNGKEEKEEKKVKERKARTLSIFSKSDKREKRENERPRLTPSKSEPVEKRKNRRSYIFFSDDDGRDDVVHEKRNNSNDTSSFSDNENESEKSKNKPSTNRFSINLDKIFGSEDDHKKSLNTNHSNLSDLFIPGNETPIKSHNRYRLNNANSLVESPTGEPRPVSMVTISSDNTDDTDLKKNDHYPVDDNLITNDDSNRHEYTVTSNEYENDQSTQSNIDLSVHQDHTEVINGDQNSVEIVNGIHKEHEIFNDGGNQDYEETFNEEINGGGSGDGIMRDEQDHQKDAEEGENHQNNTEITTNLQNDVEIIVDHQIDTGATNYYSGYVKATEGNTHQGYIDHQISIKVTHEDAESDGENNEDDRVQKTRDGTDEIPIINPESEVEDECRDEEEEVVKRNGFREVEKIVERYPLPKIIEKRVIVTQENPQTRQQLEQLQATNDNLVSVKNQLELKIEEQSQQIAKLSSLESVMVRQVQLVERMEETIRRLETKVQDQQEELDGRISGQIGDTVRHLEYRLNEKSKELDNLRTVVMDQLQPQTPPLYLSPVQVVNISGLLPASEKPSMDMTMTRQEPRDIYSKNTLVNTLVVKPLVNTLVVSAGIATSVLYAVYVRPVVGLIKVVRTGM